MLASLNKYILEFDSRYSDSRTKDWLMVRTLYPTIILTGTYLLFVKIIGPEMMKNRKPFDLKKSMIVYSGTQSVISGSIFFLIGYYGFFTRYSLICEPHNPSSTEPDDIKFIYVIWFFFLTRFFEFIETIFFILRNKFSQVSNLHIIHHALMPYLFWIDLRYTPAGHYAISPFINSFVHMIMYMYYMLAAFGPKYQKYLWWKKYLTVLQLVQFTVCLLHSLNTIISDCPVPKFNAVLVLLAAALFLVMFLNFYTKTFNISTKPNKKHVE